MTTRIYKIKKSARCILFVEVVGKIQSLQGCRGHAFQDRRDIIILLATGQLPTWKYDAVPHFWLSISCVIETIQDAPCALSYCLKCNSPYILYTVVHARGSLCEAWSKTTIYNEQETMMTRGCSLIHLIACKRFKLKIRENNGPKESKGLWWLIH